MTNTTDANTFLGLAIFAAVILVPVALFWGSLVIGERLDERRFRRASKKEA